MTPEKPQPETPEEVVVHDAIVEEIEETLPEGPSPKGQYVHITNRLLYAFGAVALSTLIVFLFLRGGPMAGGVGLFVLFCYALLGATPWMAGRLRAKEHKEVEEVVVRKLESQKPPGRMA